jgi:hypothetical protein
MNRSSRALDPAPLFAPRWSPPRDFHWRAWGRVVALALAPAIAGALLLARTIPHFTGSAPARPHVEPPAAPALPLPSPAAESAPMVIRVQGPPLVIQATIPRKGRTER